MPARSRSSRVTSSTPFSGLSTAASRIRYAHLSAASRSQSILTNEHASDGAEVQTRSALAHNHDDISDIVMAIDMRDRGTVGCAYYVAEQEKLFLVEDMKHASVDMIDMCEWAQWFAL